MYKFVRKLHDEAVEVECIHNRELTRPVSDNHLFFLMGEEFDKKFGIDKRAGEVAIYSPSFEEEFGCAWVGQASDFQIMEY